LLHSQAYEITFTGQAGTTLRAEFDDCEVTVGPDTTTLRAELLDQEVNRPGDLGGSDPWKDAESCLHSGSTPMSCVNAR
jgi:hypothetical protein